MALITATICLLFFGFVQTASPGYAWGPTQHKIWPSAVSPEFEPTPHNIIVPPGQTAMLPCRVRNLADKVVSWIRRKDLHIISSGSYIFTGDSRFQVIHPEGDSASWALQLLKPQHKDQGLYECQINTDPKMKKGVLLTVTERNPALDLTQRDDHNAYGREWATISGPKERHMKVGSTVSLTCQYRAVTASRYTSYRPPLVEWLHDNYPISIKSGVKVETQKEDGEVISYLTLGSVDLSDSGSYTCRPSHGRPATVVLYVIEGEHSEAMQGEYSSSSEESLTMRLSILFLSILFSLAIL